jgi:predicted DNA-binding protein YlxM (UPF0122 family)
MDLLERDYHISLFDIYKELLTEKQQEYFAAYYYDDLTLSEIAEEKNVSRNAVFDQVKKVINALEDYENKLGLLKKYNELSLFTNKLDEELKKELLTIIKG